MTGESDMDFINKQNAHIFLMLNAFLWGSSYVFSKIMLIYIPRFFILFLCSLGALFCMSVIYIKLNRRYNLSLINIAMCALATLISIASNTFCMLALEKTTTSNAAFIVQTSVIFTPVVSAVTEKKKIRGTNIAAGLISLIGLFVLICDLDTFSFKTGDIFALGNALFFTFYLVAQNIVLKRVDPLDFSIIFHLLNTIVFMVLFGTTERNYINVNLLGNPVLLPLVLMSIFITIFTVLAQGKALKYINPEKANIIYTLEPVAAMVLAFILIGEKPDGIRTIIGSLIILGSVMYSVKGDSLKNMFEQFIFLANQIYKVRKINFR